MNLTDAEWEKLKLDVYMIGETDEEGDTLEAIIEYCEELRDKQGAFAGVWTAEECPADFTADGLRLILRRLKGYEAKQTTLQKEIESLREAQRWRSVEDPPARCVRVWIYRPMLGCDPAYLIDDRTAWRLEIFDSREIPFSEATHWKPFIPAPPEES
jgi:hypothetical protein